MPFTPQGFKDGPNEDGWVTPQERIAEDPFTEEELEQAETAMINMALSFPESQNAFFNLPDAQEMVAYIRRAFFYQLMHAGMITDSEGK